MLVKPALASGVKINGNILLKSIGSTGAVYVQLLMEDDPDEDSSVQRSIDEFLLEINQDNHVEPIVLLHPPCLWNKRRL